MSVRVSEFDIDQYIVSPAVSSLTLYSGWSDATSAAFCQATRTVLEMNPCLTSALSKNGVGFELKPGSHKEFFKSFEGPADFVIPETTQERLQAMQKILEPLFSPYMLGISLQQAEKESPLFGVTIMLLPEAGACACIQMSHILADGSTYYKVLGQFNAVLNQLTLSEINWTPPNKSVSIPSEFSEADEFIQLKSWMPAYMKKVETGVARRSSFTFLKDVQSIKQEFGAAKHYGAVPCPAADFVSTNDLLLVGFAEVLESELLWTFSDMRGRLSNAPLNAGGNYERRISFPRALAAAYGPKFIRSAISSNFRYFETDMSPAVPFESMDVSGITNWCALVKFIEPPGVNLLAHSPMAAFVEGIAVDFAVVFHPDTQRSIAVNHNFVHSAKYVDRVKQSKVFSRLMQPQQSA